MTISLFRIVALLEGISCIVLFFVAMPLKHFAGMPEAVKYTGWIHGILFLIFSAFLVWAWNQYRWSFTTVFLAFLSSLIPFGTFILDAKLLKKKLQ